MALRVCALTDAEQVERQRRAQSRTAPACVVERARMVLGGAAGETAPAVARRWGVGPAVVRRHHPAARCPPDLELGAAGYPAGPP